MWLLVDHLRRFFAPLRAAGLLAVALAGAAPAAAEPLTLWLTRPLYPGQESLVARTDATLASLFPEQSRATEVVGREGLARRLKDTEISLACILGEVACEDPVEALVSGLGVTRVVLLKAGQDETGYRYRVTSWMPGSSEPAQVGEGSGSVLERALLAALVKVVPLSATVEVESVPTGAAVFVDGERVGTTPAILQVLPGAHVVKLELPSHLPVEVLQQLPARGAVRISRALEKVPARLVVMARPAGVAISVDGVASGVDKLDRGIQPGAHAVALSLEGHIPYEEKLEIAPGATATVDRTLEPTTWTRLKRALGEAQDEEAARRVYVQAGYERGAFASADARSFAGTFPQLTSLDEGNLPELQGGAAEVGMRWRYGGLLLAGGSFLTSGGDSYPATLKTKEDAVLNGARVRVRTAALRLLQPQLQLLLWRFAFNVQGGFAGRVVAFLPGGGQNLFDTTTRWQLDPLLEAQGRVRFTVVGGLYLEGSFRHSRPLLDGRAAINSFEGGLGLAF
jgi:hypothetical protein